MLFSAVLVYHENPVDCPKIGEVQWEKPTTLKQLSKHSLMQDVKPLTMEKSHSGFNDTLKLSSFSTFCGQSGFKRKDQYRKISIENSFSIREVLLAPLVEKTKLVVMQKNHFENLYAIFNNTLGIFGRSRIGSKIQKCTNGSLLCSR